MSIHLRIEPPDFAAGAAISIVAAIEALGGGRVSRVGALIVSSSAPSLMAGGGGLIAAIFAVSGILKTGVPACPGGGVVPSVRWPEAATTPAGAGIACGGAPSFAGAAAASAAGTVAPSVWGAATAPLRAGVAP